MNSAVIFRIFRFFAILLVLSRLSQPLAQAQFPFPTIDQGGEDPQQLPENVPTDLIAQRISPRETAADKLARLFNRELRDIEERQREIIQELDKLPKTSIETFSSQALGYVSGSSRSRPKWVQIDLGETVMPDAIALFPVTVQYQGETIFGYGFPRAFRIDISDDPGFNPLNYETIKVGRLDQKDGSRRSPYFLEVGGYEGRYVRVTATDMWRSPEGDQRFALSEIMVLKGERNLALRRPRPGEPPVVTSRDTSEKGNNWSKRFVNDGITALGIPQGAEDSPTIGYRSSSKADIKESWVQLDLGESMPIQEIRIILANYPSDVPEPAIRFLYPIKLEVSENPDMRGAEPLGRPIPAGKVKSIGNNNPLIVPVNDGYGRYVRLTVTQSKATPMSFSLAELQVYSENQNVALGKSVVGSHAQTGKGLAPQYLVDGYSSTKNLIDYQTWISNLDQRNQLYREFFEIKEDRGKLVDDTLNRGLIGATFGLLGGLVLAMVIFAQGKVRRRKDLESLRQRIASDLHDDIGSNLSSIALLAELGKTEANEPELIVEELTDIKNTADKTIESMRDIVWLIRPGEETWKQMMTRFRETASKLLRAHEYSFDETGHMHDDRLPLEFKRDFFLIYKEVLNNIVRHAEAKTVTIEVVTTRGRLDLTIKDDGKGFDNLDSGFREGNGLRNLRMRAQAIGAKLKVKSTLKAGTTVQLTAPLP